MIRLITQGEAKSSEALLHYVDLLTADKALSRAYVVREAKVAHGRLLTVEFEVHASLSGA